MKQLLLSFLFTLAVPCLGFAQDFALNYRLGYGSYQMGSLNALQQETLRSLVVEAQATDRYPAFYNHQIQGLIKFDKVWLGASYLKMSSGSRISYKDYSGQIAIDTKIVSDGLGFFAARPLLDHAHWEVVVGGQSILNFSSLDYLGMVLIGDQKETQSLEVYATGIILEPLARISGKNGIFEIGVEGSYRLNLVNEDFHLKGKKDHKLVDDGGKGIKPDWSGTNIGLVCGFSF